MILWSCSGLVVGHGGVPLLHLGARRVTGGQAVVVQGSNGGGKSSLLATIAGALAPVSGRMVSPGRRSWMPQVGGLGPMVPTTLKEMVALAGGDSAAALESVGLESRAHQTWAASSGGERQRALLARALAPAPHLLLLDEPDSHLDAAGRSLLARCLEGHRRAGGAWIAVLHRDLEVTVTDRWTCEAGEVRHDPC